MRKGVNWVPPALIRQVCYPTGKKRLPKLDRLVFPEPKMAKLNPTFNYPYTGSYTAPYQVSAVNRIAAPSYATTPVNNGVPMPGNLQNDLYRFMLGRPDRDSLSAVCRWCDTIMNRDSCRDHLKEVNGICKVAILRCIQELRVEGKCCACDRKTTGRTWGVPLCSIKCENVWRMNNTRSFRFERDQEQLRRQAAAKDGL